VAGRNGQGWYPGRLARVTGFSQRLPGGIAREEDGRVAGLVRGASGEMVRGGSRGPAGCPTA